MKNIIIITILMVSFLVVAGCGIREVVIQPDNKSYIWLSGNIDGVVVIVDSNKPLLVTGFNSTNSQREELDSDKRMLYEVKPGKHEVIVKRNGKVVVHRVIIINSGSIKEINVP